MKKLLFLAIMFAFIACSSLWAADATGSWTVKMKNPKGEDETFTLTIEGSDSNLGITCNDHPAFKTLEGTGTLDGEAITMNLKSSGDRPMELVFTGTISDDSMSGTAKPKGHGGHGGHGHHGSPPSGSGTSQGGTPPEPPSGGNGGPPHGHGGPVGAPDMSWTATRN